MLICRLLWCLRLFDLFTQKGVLQQENRVG